ncbi:MAG TPA: S8 family serine peptidase [Blastocatellia bacterium]|nr:S8 family serine peptidase [Blastocatellia bacterium]
MLPSAAVSAEEQQSFIVRLDDYSSSAAWQAKLAAFGGRVTRRHETAGLVTIEAPRTAIRQLAADGTIAYVSPDRPVVASGFVEDPMGAEQVRALASGSGLIGTNIGLAILDSGIDETHNAIKAGTSHPGVVYRQDFTGSGSASDIFGHGTHVATMAAGSDSFKSGDYTGIAPGARLISLCVLNGQGLGAASNIIAALDWCVTNKATYNIRVINLSLGAMAKDSYKNDPLCQAARRAVNAGIVVVAAAGNDGKDASGRKIYGGIHSSGIDPSVITVGASNMLGTVDRTDDIVTTFSSRGPTRGYTTDALGIRHYDNLIKPDLVAAGNKLLGACATGSWNNSTSLIRKYPALNPQTAASTTDQLIYLSGTSMAAPVVAGAAALMLQLNPALTPNLVKAILMYTAQPLKGFNTFEQGAGELNIDGAARLAKLVKTTLPTSTGAALLTASLPTQQSTIFGCTFKWGRA